METEEMMKNEENIVDAAEEVVEKVGSNVNVWKIIVKAGAIGIAGYFGYKYVAKPVIANIKAKKEQNRFDSEELEQGVIDIDSDDPE